VTAPVTTLLAHQGGWDEILMVVVPVAVFGVLLAAANRRAQRQRGTRTPESEAAPPTRRGPI